MLVNPQATESSSSGAKRRFSEFLSWSNAFLIYPVHTGCNHQISRMTVSHLATELKTNAANRRVNELYTVTNGQVVSCPGKSRLQLEQASRVTGYYQVRVYARYVCCFSITELCGGFRLHEIVDTGRATTDRGFRNLQDFEIRDTAQHSARL